MLLQNAEQLLRERFLLSEFRPGQQQVIECLLAGQSALAVFPTGGGKSLCYQLPALLFEGLTLVVSPLIALMQDQVDRLQSLGIAAERLDSTRTASEVRAIYQGMREGQIKLLYVAPERLQNERFTAVLSGTRISLLAVDEAHCISEWGHNFRPDYLKLAGLAKELCVERVLGLTATATPEVARDICKQFDVQSVNHIQTGFYRSNLQLQVHGTTQSERLELLVQLMSQRAAEPSIVYVTLQQTAEDIARHLCTAGINASAYHAGMNNELRERTQNAFMEGQVQTIVATIAFGMGIDKSDIRAIYHYNLPKSLESYMQEIGRAGRDGLPACCDMLVCEDDIRILENFSYGDTPITEHLMGLVEYILGQGEQFSLSVYELSGQFDIRPLVVNTALTYLELAGVVRSTGPFYSTYQIEFKIPKQELLNRFDEARAAFLSSFFSCGKQGKKWLTIDSVYAAEKMQEPRERFVKAIQYMEEQALITTQVKGVRQGYRRLSVPNFTELCEHLKSLFVRREQQDISRVKQVLAYTQAEKCLPRNLCEYFGEQLPQGCGVCSYCRGYLLTLKELDKLWVIGEENRKVIQKVIAERLPALQHPRQVARFVCGLPSPATTRSKLCGSKLRGHSGFGVLADFPFKVVLDAITAMEQS